MVLIMVCFTAGGSATEYRAISGHSSFNEVERSPSTCKWPEKTSSNYTPPFFPSSEDEAIITLTCPRSTDVQLRRWAGQRKRLPAKLSTKLAEGVLAHVGLTKPFAGHPNKLVNPLLKEEVTEKGVKGERMIGT